MGNPFCFNSRVPSPVSTSCPTCKLISATPPKPRGTLPRPFVQHHTTQSRLFRIIPHTQAFPSRSKAFGGTAPHVWGVQGAIDMHLPERWGVLQFAEGTVNQTAPQRYPHWATREVAMSLYHAQKAYATTHNGSYTSDVAALAVRLGLS